MLPQLKLLKTLWGQRAAVLAVVVLLLFAVISTKNKRIKELETFLAELPETTENIVTHEITGPVRIEYRTIEKPGAEKIVERIVYRDRAEKDQYTSRTGKPACPPVAANTIQAPRYVGLGVDPLRPEKPRLRAGLAVFNALELGVAYDTRFAPVNGAVQAEVSYRF